MEKLDSVSFDILIKEQDPYNQVDCKIDLREIRFFRQLL